MEIFRHLRSENVEYTQAFGSLVKAKLTPFSLEERQDNVVKIWILRIRICPVIFDLGNIPIIRKFVSWMAPFCFAAKNELGWKEFTWNKYRNQ